MHQSAVILRPHPGWTSVLSEVLPGAHVILQGTLDDALVARRQGLYMRDCLEVLTPNETRTLFLYRAPLDADTVAANVLKYSTGGIHLQACHVGDDVRVNQPCGSPDNAYSGGWDSNPQPTLALGRWPTNLALIHSPACRLEGKARIRVSAPPKAGVDIKDKYKQTYELGWSVRSTVHHGQDGWEEVDNWICDSCCPALEINERAKAHATRFYPQFKDDAEFHAWILRLVALEGLEPLVIQ